MLICLYYYGRLYIKEPGNRRDSLGERYCNFYVSHEIELHYYVLDVLHILSHLVFVPIDFTEEEFKPQGVNQLAQGHR